MFQTVVTIYGAIAATGGFLLMGWGPTFLRYLGPEVMGNNGSSSLIRWAGVGLFLFGALMLSLQPLRDAALQRNIGVGMAVCHALAGFLLVMQQIAIWNSALGMVIAAWPFVAAAAFAVALQYTPAEHSLASD